MAAMADVTAVTIGSAPNIHRFGSGGVSKRVFGVTDATLTITQKAQGGGPDFLAGSKASSVSILEKASGESIVLAGAICLDVAYNYDQDTGAPVEYVYTCAAHGASVAPDGSGTAAAGFSSKNAAITWTAV